MKSLRLFALVFSFLALARSGHAQAPTLTAEQKAEATKIYNKGSTLYKLGKFDEAIVEFERGYSMTQSAAFLYNLAQSYRYSGKLEKALTLYKNFRSQEPNSPLLGDVNKTIADLTKTLDEQRAAVAKREEEERQKREAAELRKEELERQKAIEAEKERARREAELRAQGFQEAKPKPHFKLHLVGFGLVGAGVAVLGAGAALTGLAAKFSSDLTNGSGEFTTALNDKNKSGKTFGTAGPALLGAGGVIAIAGVAAIVIGLKWKKQDKEKGLTAITPWLDRDALGLAAGGRF